jgi:prolyl oligopeptidase
MLFISRRYPLALIILLSLGCEQIQEKIRPDLVYPETRKSSVTDNYHGTLVSDPYRWLEDADSEETRTWIQAQNAITFPWLAKIHAREKIQKRLTRLWDYEKYGIPFKRGNRYFYSLNNGLQNQSVIYWTESLDREPKILLDPNTLSEDGTIAMGRYAVSEDGRWMAYGLSSGGSDWTEWHVRSVDSGQDRPDHLKWIKFSGASWDKTGTGFYYSRYDAPKEGQKLQEANYYQKVYYHKVGTDQSQDILVYERPDQKEWTFNARVTDDGQYLILNVGKGTERKNLVFLRKTDDPDAPFMELVSEFMAQFSFIDNDGPLFWFRTDLDAPKGKVIAVDLDHSERKNWQTILPEGEEVLRSVNIVGNTFFATYLKDAHTQIRLYDLDGTFLRLLELPGLCSAFGFGGKRSDQETFYRSTSFNDPGTLYRYDVKTGESVLFRRPRLDFNPDDYVTRQVFYESKDGTRVPLFLTHRKGLKQDGNNPVILYGYGGFNSAMTPSFRLSKLVWMEMGGIYAVANIRGGGEYGRAWHESGKKLQKQNTFDDFIAAAEWLIQNDYTCKEKLAIQGASNGGLLVGACMTQRPDLFGACLPAVGVMDMLRFVKFTIGWAWTSDYGSPEDPEEFKTLYAYSPYHNLRDGVAYPATLITTADHDDRVVPAHSFKFAARLQEAHTGDAPVLIRIETRAGHGGGKPTTKRIEEAADILAFLTRIFDLEA